MKNQDYSRKILKILSENRALSFSDITSELVKDTAGNAKNDPKKAVYAVNRSLKGLIESGVIERHFSGQNNYARLTESGRKKATTLKLESDTSLLPNWDGQWRIVLLDLPESRKSEREALRYLLKKAGFTCLKNSAWITPYPFEHLFMNIKKDLGLTTEMMIITTYDLDPETQSELIRIFQN
jgi:DNA-binding transcriptional regulator PaaX